MADHFTNGVNRACQEIANKSAITNGFGKIGTLRGDLTSVASKLSSAASDSSLSPEEKKACKDAERLVDKALFAVDK